ncbi:MAG: hypothetical protein DRP55_05330, partial [Spirochaetes bacterium]
NIEGFTPIQNINDIPSLIKEAKAEGAILSPLKLIDIADFLSTVSFLKKFFSPYKDSHSFTWEKIKDLIIIDELKERIKNSISPDGEIVDSASFELENIRKDIIAQRKAIYDRLEGMIYSHKFKNVVQDDFVTIRNDRYVIPVKPEFKGYFHGIIHGQSQTGLTYFVEPIELVPLNNELHLLLIKEREEKLKILKDLTDEVRNFSASLLSNFKILVYFDLVIAIARYAEEIKGIIPLINSKGKIKIIEARHPLLIQTKGDRCVPIDIILGDKYQIMVISGANAGGKTAALKTLGLLTLMTQAGIPIPAKEGSEISIFNQIFADVGDEQSLTEDLSTFSSKILFLKEIEKGITRRSLVLLDELGTGTDSNEGSALAMGVVDLIKERGAISAITTHLDRLKTYAYLSDDVENVSVQFDSETFTPTYKLHYGTAGTSRGLLIAKEIGLPETILKYAEKYIDQEAKEGIDLIERLEKLKEELEKEKEEVAFAHKKLIQARKRVKRIINNLKEKKYQILEKTKKEGLSIIKRIEKELREGIRKQKDNLYLDKFPSKLFDNAKERINAEIKVKPSKKKREFTFKFKEGDEVWIRPLKKKGIFSSFLKNSKCEVMVEKGVKIALNEKDLFPYKGDNIDKRKKEEKQRGISFSIKPTSFLVKKELNVVGLTVEEAIPIVDKFIDTAILHGVKEVEIIHGIGSGKLGKAIREHLKKHSYIQSIKQGEIPGAGPGVTQVEIGG